MKELTFTIKAYEYNELSQDAKNNVRTWLYETQEPYFFNEELKAAIFETFNNSHFYYSYALNRCQGDGLSIYGNLSPLDIKTYFKENTENFTVKQLKRIYHYCDVLEKLGINCNIDKNYYRYEYFNKDSAAFDIRETYIYELETAYYRNIDTDLIYDMSKTYSEYLSQFCYDWEKHGYEYFEWAFNAPDEEISELCDANEWLFDESGALL